LLSQDSLEIIIINYPFEHLKIKIVYTKLVF